MEVMNLPTFSKKIEDCGVSALRHQTEIVQINLGKLCNQACSHCHVEAGPNRTEIMDETTIERILKLISEAPSIHTVDLTGGAPELNPHFRALVKEIRKLKKRVIDRCNLTVFFEPGQEDTPQFLKSQQVHIVASLPCYSQKNVDFQRGTGVFDKSIEVIKILNQLGFGKIHGSLFLDLVYNPGGAFLPPEQSSLEATYKKELLDLFGIKFNRLLTITNMPIKRFYQDLIRNKKLDSYMDLLYQNFNVNAAQEIMCKNLISIGFDGEIFDCDFNQMQGLPLGQKRSTVYDIEKLESLQEVPISFAAHCYGCTAGAGSSCSGALLK